MISRAQKRVDDMLTGEILWAKCHKDDFLLHVLYVSFEDFQVPNF